MRKNPFPHNHPQESPSHKRGYLELLCDILAFHPTHTLPPLLFVWGENLGGGNVWCHTSRVSRYSFLLRHHLQQTALSPFPPFSRLITMMSYQKNNKK